MPWSNVDLCSGPNDMGQEWKQTSNLNVLEIKQIMQLNMERNATFLITWKLAKTTRAKIKRIMIN